MTSVVNLNRARKAKAQVEAKALAASNRVKHGRTAAQKAADALTAAKAERALEGHKREE
ncbi:hypothetical protein BH09PSE2_BH09PSE2_05200 [soil metagenome]